MYREAWRSWQVYKKILELQKTKYFDVIQFAELGGEGYYYFLDPLKKRKNGLNRKPATVITLHSSSKPFNKVVLEKQLSKHAETSLQMEAFCEYHADAIVSPCSYTANLVKKATGLKDLKTVIIPNPMDTDTFLPSAQPGGKQDKIQILAVGTLRSAKGTDTLIKAFLKAGREIPGLTLRLIGKDTRESGKSSYRAFLQSLLAGEPNADGIEIIDQVDRDKLVEYYQQCDFCIIASRNENFPYVVMEAMACGKPVIASRVGGIPDIVGQEGQKMLYEAGNENELTKKIIEMVNQRKEWSHIGNSNRERMMKEFSLGRILSGYLSLYAGLVKAKKESNEFKMKKIIYIAYECGLYGPQASTRNRILGMRKLGVESHIVFINGGNGKRTFGDIPYWIEKDCSRIVDLIRAGKYDCISFINTIKLMPRILDHLNYSGRVVFELRGGRIHDAAMRGILEKYADVIIVPSGFVKNVIQLNLNPAVSIEILPHPTDPELFQRRSDREGRPFQSIPHGAKPLGWTGRLYPWKNWKEYLEIVRECSRKDPNIEGWMIGEIVENPNYPEFREQTKKMGLTEKIRVFRQLRYEQMPYFYTAVANAGGCLLTTSIVEGYQNAVIEAMACTCPVVAMKNPSIRDIIEDGTNGFLFDAHDIAGAFKCIQTLLSDPSLYQTFVAQARKNVTEVNDPVRVGRKFVEIVEKQHKNGIRTDLDGSVIHFGSKGFYLFQKGRIVPIGREQLSDMAQGKEIIELNEDYIAMFEEEKS